MIDLLQAREAAKAELRRMEARYHRDREFFVLLDENTISRAWGWVFFYQSRRFVETGDMNYALGGNGPMIVDRTAGKVHHTESHFSVDKIIAEYEASLAQNTPPRERGPTSG